MLRPNYWSSTTNKSFPFASLQNNHRHHHQEKALRCRTIHQRGIPHHSSLYFSLPRCFSYDARFDTSLKAIESTSIPELSSLFDDQNDEVASSLEQGSRLLLSQSEIAKKKLNHLLEGLNPSQVAAVTQPVVDLRCRIEDDHNMMLRSDDSTLMKPSSNGAIITRVIAGPGSGKTKVLTTRIAYVLQQQQLSIDGFQRHVGNVLAVTFTRKAAGEMRERLQRLLRELEHIEQAEKDHDEEDDAVRLDRHGNVFVDFVEEESDVESAATPPPGLERVELGTFHSVCAKIMRYNGELLQHLPSVARDMVFARGVPFRSNEEQTDEDKDDERSEGLPSEPLSAVMPVVNLNQNFIIADQAEQLRILKGCLEECYKNDANITSVKNNQVLSSIGAIKEKFAQGQDPFLNEKNEKPSAALSIARKVYYRYREKFLSKNTVDFDDLILMTRELLIENEELRKYLHKRWPHVLVDEFQDTSKTQLDLVKLLTSSTLFVVGDNDQSIYSWRGAHVGSLHDVQQDFSSYGAVHTVHLRENYRSTPNIVRAAERVIATNNEGQRMQDDVRLSMKAKRESGANPRIVACADGKAEANFVVETLFTMMESQKVAQTDTVAILYRTNSQSRQLEEACVAKGLPYVIRGGAGGFYKRSEIKDCLCFLRWLYNGDDDGSMLRAMKTPSKGIGDKAVQEFQSYCYLVQHYVREHAPQSYCCPTMLDVLISMTVDNGNAANGVFFMLPSDAPQAAEYISKRSLKNFLSFSSKMRDLRLMAYEKSVEELLTSIIDEFELTNHFNTNSKSKAEFSDRMENVQELRQASEKYTELGTALVMPNEGDSFDSESGLSRFLDDVALVSEFADTEGKEGKNNDRMVVNLMTIHASKGMEFDVVFVVGLEEGTLPSAFASLDKSDGQMDEERRLCYVAITRAKSHLILTWRRECTIYSDLSGPRVVQKKRSRFLDALVSKKTKAENKESKQNFGLEASKDPPVMARLVHRKKDAHRGLNGSQLTKGREYSSLSMRMEWDAADGRNKDWSKPTLETRERPKSISPNTSPVLKKRLVKRPPKKTTKKNATTIPSSRSASPTSNHIELSHQRKQHHKPTPSLVDPTWFFPIGENVLHRNLGKGVVLGHTPGIVDDEIQVRIQFKNGDVLEFPALGTDIVPDIGR
jgi:DNA helicase II / ATP-dependent DNA helicase PcrA